MNGRTEYEKHSTRRPRKYK